jgi:hypothetical protein
VDGGVVYTLSRNGLAFALDAATGEPRWQADLMTEHGAKNNDYGLTGSPLVAATRALQRQPRGIALDQKTGKKLWSSTSGYGGFASPVASTAAESPAWPSSARPSSASSTPRPASRSRRSPGRRRSTPTRRTRLLRREDLHHVGLGPRLRAPVALGRPALPVWQNTELRSQIASPVYLDGHPVRDRRQHAQRPAALPRRGDGKDEVDAQGRLRKSSRGRRPDPHDRQAGDARRRGGRSLGLQGAGAARGAWIEGQELDRPVLADGLLYCRDSEGTLVCLDVR